SVPFSVALAVTADARDPRTFCDVDANDPKLRSVIKRGRLVPWDTPQPTPIACQVTLMMSDGRVVRPEVTDCKGTPANPLSASGLRDKVLLLTGDHDAASMAAMFDRLLQIEDEAGLDWICV